MAALAIALSVGAATATDAPPEPPDYRTDDYRSPTPATLRGATVLSTEAAHALWHSHDAAFIDNVYLPLPDSAIAARLAILPLPNGQNRIQVQGLSDRQYVIQASANLVNWNSVATNVSDSGTIQWTDPQPANQPQRFYRSIAP